MDTPLGPNPFAAGDSHFRDWETASRRAAEEWARFHSDHLKQLPAESEPQSAFIEWRTISIAARFDIQAKWLCILSVSSYESCEVYLDCLDGIIQKLISHARGNSSNGVRPEYFASEVRIRLSQRKQHWSAEALRCVREIEAGKIRSSAPPTANVSSEASDATNGNSPADKPAATDGSPADTPIRTPRRVPDLATSLARVQLAEELASELAAVNRDVKAYCTIELLKAKHPNFALWKILEDPEIQELVDAEDFRPKAFAEALVMRKYGLTSRETLKKDRQKLRREQKKRSK